MGLAKPIIVLVIVFSPWDLCYNASHFFLTFHFFLWLFWAQTSKGFFVLQLIFMVCNFHPFLMFFLLIVSFSLCSLIHCSICILAIMIFILWCFLKAKNFNTHNVCSIGCLYDGPIKFLFNLRETPYSHKFPIVLHFYELSHVLTLFELLPLHVYFLFIIQIIWSK